MHYPEVRFQHDRRTHDSERAMQQARDLLIHFSANHQCELQMRTSSDHVTGRQQNRANHLVSLRKRQRDFFAFDQIDCVLQSVDGGWQITGSQQSHRFVLFRDRVPWVLGREFLVDHFCLVILTEREINMCLQGQQTIFIAMLGNHSLDLIQCTQSLVRVHLGDDRGQFRNNIFTATELDLFARVAGALLVDVNVHIKKSLA